MKVLTDNMQTFSLYFKHCTSEEKLSALISRHKIVKNIEQIVKNIEQIVKILFHLSINLDRKNAKHK